MNGLVCFMQLNQITFEVSQVCKWLKTIPKVVMDRVITQQFLFSSARTGTVIVNYEIVVGSG